MAESKPPKPSLQPAPEHPPGGPPAEAPAAEGAPPAAGQQQRKSAGMHEAPPAAGHEPRKSGAEEPKRDSKAGATADAAAAATPAGPPKPMKPRKSMLEQLLAEIPGNKPAAGVQADKGAKELAGKVHTYFATDDRLAEIQALKPLRRPKLVYDNTYRLSAYNPFNRDRVEKVMEVTLEEMLPGIKYNSETGGEIATKIAEKLRARVMSLRFDRYKIIVITNVGPVNRQGLHIGFRFLWDTEKDTYVTGTLKTPQCFCTAVIYGVYFE